MSRKTFLELRIRGFEGRPEGNRKPQSTVPLILLFVETQEGRDCLFCFFLVAQASFIFYLFGLLLGLFV